MTDSMKFGPGWLRKYSTPNDINVANASNSTNSAGSNQIAYEQSGNNVSNSSSAASTRYEIPEFSYGREIMLSLFDEIDCKIPDILPKFKSLFVEISQTPLGMEPAVEEETRWPTRSFGGIGRSGSTFENTNSFSGRGGFNESSRGRGVRGYVRSYSGIDDDPRSNTGQRNDRSWEDRDGVEIDERMSPRKDYYGSSNGGGFRGASATSDNWRRLKSDGDSKNDKGDWRSGSGTGGHTSSHKWGRSTSWRDGTEPPGFQSEKDVANPFGGDGNKRPGFMRSHSSLTSSSINNRSGGDNYNSTSFARPPFSSSINKHSGDGDNGNGNTGRKWHSGYSEEDRLPEWAIEESGDNTGGSFDASGAFCGFNDKTAIDKSSPNISGKLQEDRNIKSESNNQDSIPERVDRKIDENNMIQSLTENSNEDISSERNDNNREKIPHNSIVPEETGMPKIDDSNERSRETPDNLYEATNKIEKLILDLVENPDENYPINETKKQDANELNDVQKIIPGLHPQPMRGNNNVSYEQHNSIQRDQANNRPITTGVDSWLYLDPQGMVQGEFSAMEMTEWYQAGYFDNNLMVRRKCDTRFLKLGDLVEMLGGEIPFLSPRLNLINSGMRHPVIMEPQYQRHLESQVGNVPIMSNLSHEQMLRPNEQMRFNLPQSIPVNKLEYETINNLLQSRKNDTMEPESITPNVSLLDSDVSGGYRGNLNPIPHQLQQLLLSGKTIPPAEQQRHPNHFLNLFGPQYNQRVTQLQSQPQAIERGHVPHNIHPQMQNMHDMNLNMREINTGVMHDMNLHNLMRQQRSPQIGISNANLTHPMHQITTTPQSGQAETDDNIKAMLLQLSMQKNINTVGNNMPSSEVPINRNNFGINNMDHMNYLGQIEKMQIPLPTSISLWDESPSNKIILTERDVIDDIHKTNRIHHSSDPRLPQQVLLDNHISQEQLQMQQPIQQDRIHQKEINDPQNSGICEVVKETSDEQKIEHQHRDMNQQQYQLRLMNQQRNQENMISTFTDDLNAKKNNRILNDERPKKQKKSVQTKEEQQQPLMLKKKQQQQQQQVREEIEEKRRLQEIAEQRKLAKLGSMHDQSKEQMMPQGNSMTSQSQSMAPWLQAPVAVQNVQVQSLTEIQKAERAEQQKRMELAMREEKERLMNEDIERQKREVNSSQLKWNTSHIKVKSLAEIQAEEARKQAELNKEMELKMSAANDSKNANILGNGMYSGASISGLGGSNSSGKKSIQSSSIWGQSPQNLFWNSKNSNKQQQLFNNPSESFWESSGNSKSIPSGSTLADHFKSNIVNSYSSSGIPESSNNSKSNRENIIRSQTVSNVAQKKNISFQVNPLQDVKKSNPKLKTNGPGVNQNLSKGKTKDKEMFSEWCTQALKPMKMVIEVDVPTFITFLQDIESPYDVKDYIRSYLGESKEANEFTKQYLERRSKLKNEQRALKSHIDDMCAPAPAINPSSSNDFQEVKGKTKKVKKKVMMKVDSKNLGFSVTSAEDRLNVGDRDYGELA